MKPSEFVLSLPGDPVAKARPRVYQGHAITPKKTLHAEERIFAEFRRRYPSAKPFAGPVGVYAEFWMSKRGKPDIDNLLKLILDALNAVAYLDDSQIQRIGAIKIIPDQLVPGKRPGTTRKRRREDPYTYHGKEYEPHLLVRIKSLPEYDPAKNLEGDES
ncbi:RusA family crossover junction endodeoxyribonuclease [Bifidobacterium aerophilum]|uniref:RusA family crossover junction endodeoxyribonuclease n=1 Tax=Bifidobacterium aerophilum TaxID=1798155 RepID=A0A6N9Z7V3_9BIFI|nr:RusA family crossover junction endodeoxyribonuclease [Bifidobacterium aerophilum]NEG90581.1 RusA family crossover junction endodeoxyribonuclease [Bifidobacterium aerophilum]